MRGDNAHWHIDLHPRIRLYFSIPLFFFFNDTATTEIYTLSLHDALPISAGAFGFNHVLLFLGGRVYEHGSGKDPNDSWTLRVPLSAVDFIEISHLLCHANRSEEHTSELQSRQYLVCRLLLEKKKT